MSAFLLTWNPKYYTPRREKKIVAERGQFYNYWSTRCRQMEVDDHLFLMRQGKDPRGIVAVGQAGLPVRKKRFIRHNGRWFVAVMWTWFQPEDPMFTLDDLRMLFPDQHWSPRGSGIQIKPPVDDELIELMDKAITERKENN